MLHRCWIVAALLQVVVAVRRVPLFRALEVPPITATSDVALQNFGGTQFVGTIGIGTPAQTMPAMFDTGSFDSWAQTSTYCDQSDICNTNGFDPSSSSSLVESSAPFSVRYLVGSVSGSLAADVVAVGALTTRTPSRFGMVESQDEIGKVQAFDSLVGMGPNSTILHQLLDQAVREGDGRVFSFYLSDAREGGSLSLGGYDASHLDGDNSSLLWFEAVATPSARALPYWIVPQGDVEFGGIKLSSGVDILIDSGTSFIIGPASAVQSIYRSLGAVVHPAGMVECWRIMTLPTLVLTIQGHRIELRPDQYAYRGKDRWTCNLAIMAINDESRWILGDVFMLNFISVFTFEDPSLEMTSSSRPGTLPTELAQREVRHWVGLGPVSPPRLNPFPSPTWFHSQLFFNLVAIVIVFLGVLVVTVVSALVMGCWQRRGRPRPPPQAVAPPA